VSKSGSPAVSLTIWYPLFCSSNAFEFNSIVADGCNDSILAENSIEASF
jgi:hypothetical protein